MSSERNQMGKVSAWEPRSGDVVDILRRCRGASAERRAGGTPCTPQMSEPRSARCRLYAVWQGMEVWRKWYEVWWKSGPDDIAAPQLTPTLLYLLCPGLGRAAWAALPRRGLSTTSPLRGSEAVTFLSVALLSSSPLRASEAVTFLSVTPLSHTQLSSSTFHPPGYCLRSHPTVLLLVTAWEPRSGDVVENPCRPQRSKGARG